MKQNRLLPFRSLLPATEAFAISSELVLDDRRTSALLILPDEVNGSVIALLLRCQRQCTLVRSCRVQGENALACWFRDRLALKKIVNLLIGDAIGVLIRP